MDIPDPASKTATRPGLRRSLGTLQAFTLSLAIVGPTIAMAFNVTLATQAAGRAAPLAFVVGTAAVFLIGLSFVAFARRVASAGSVTAYVETVFGPRWGFLTGWALLLTYLCFMTSTSALAGGFVATALTHLGVHMPGLWLAVALAAAALTIALGGQEIRRLTNLMLVIEACAVLAILVLAIVILAKVPWPAEPFQPDPGKGLSGVGYGMAFAVLSFAGFEGASTVAEETHDPQRAIPWAILGSVIVAGLLYVVICYAQVVGFGLDRVADLAGSEAPLDTLSQRYISGGYGVVLDVASGISALGCALGSATAAARLLFALGRAGLFGGLGLGTVETRHGTPRRAARVVGGLNVLGLIAIGAWAGRHHYAEAAATIGTLAILLVYVGIGAAHAVDAGRAGMRLGIAVGLLGAAALLWPLFTSLSPAPPWPGNLWPFLVMLWMAIGAGLGRRTTATPDAASRAVF